MQSFVNQLALSGPSSHSFNISCIFLIVEFFSTITMRLATASNIIAAFLALSPVAIATPHASIARRHMHHHHKKHTLVKRGQCEFPSGKGLVSVTPGAMNAGWAMSPDQPCKPGMYCPYACPPGQLMAQWDPKATSYTYPASMVSLLIGADWSIRKSC